MKILADSFLVGFLLFAFFSPAGEYRLQFAFFLLWFFSAMLSDGILFLKKKSCKICLLFICIYLLIPLQSNRGDKNPILARDPRPASAGIFPCTDLRIKKEDPGMTAGIFPFRLAIKIRQELIRSHQHMLS